MEEASPKEEGRGKITLTPDPLPWDPEVCLVLHWETNPRLEAEVFVSTGGDTEKLVQRGESGASELNWIQPETDYEFRLYEVQAPRRLLHSVRGRRAAIPWASLLKALNHQPSIPNKKETEIADFVAAIVLRYLHSPKFPEWFRHWEKSGFHVTPVHFYQPIPDTGDLGGVAFKKIQDLPGLDMNREMQLALVREVFPRFREELAEIP